MKTTIVSVLLAFCASFVSAQPVMTSYADVFPATESRLGSLSSIRKVEDTAVASVTFGSFASKIVFPDGVTSVTFSTATFTVESWVNGVYTAHTPAGVNMALSKFNPEDDVSLPSIFARSTANALIVPVNSNLVGTAIPNPKIFYITEHKAANLPQLVNVGDYWKMYRTLSGTYTVGEVVTPFSFNGQVATVIVVNESEAPIFQVSSDYPVDPVISFQIVGGLNTITATGVTVSSYNKTWWVETSTNLVDWTVDNTVTVSPSVTITTPFIPTDPYRFWRIAILQP